MPRKECQKESKQMNDYMKQFTIKKGKLEHTVIPPRKTLNYETHNFHVALNSKYNKQQHQRELSSPSSSPLPSLTPLSSSPSSPPLNKMKIDFLLN